MSSHCTTCDPSSCPFCSRQFSRVDVAKRHAKTCRSRNGRALGQVRRGRRLRACDECSRVKVSCDRKVPCERCCLKGRDCVYSWRCDHSEPQRNGRLAVSFLLNYASPDLSSKAKAMAQDLESMSDETERPSLWERLPQPSHGVETIDPRFLFLDCFDEADSQDLGFQGMSDILSADALSSRLELLVSELRAGAGDRFTRDLEQAITQGFFTSDSFYGFIDVFHRRRHYQLSTIHWPTFVPEQVPLPLLLGVGLVGAIYANYGTQSSTLIFPGCGFIDLAEKYIHKRLKRVCTCSSSSPPSEILQHCQAALLVNSMQMQVNDARTCRRISDKRHPAVISILRTYGFLIAKSAGIQDTSQLIERETWIRVITWAFMADAIKTLFYNVPPIMTVSEMAIDLPCDEELWATASPDTWEARRCRNSANELYCIKDIIFALLQDEWLHMSSRLCELPCQRLQILVPVFAILIFNYHTSMVSKPQYAVLTRALDRWQILWDTALTRFSAEENRINGTAKHSRDVVALLKMLVGVVGTQEVRGSKYLERSAQYETDAFYAFLQELHHRFGESGQGR